MGNFVSEIASVFSEALFPLVLFCGIGAVADRFLEFDRQTLSRAAVYIFSPPLAFTTLLKVDVGTSDVIRVVFFTMTILAVMAVTGWIYCRICKLDEATSSGAMLAVVFFNAFNLGFPVALFRFGEHGLQLAAVLVAVIAIPHNGFGLFLAARGTLTRRQAFSNLLRMPMLYVLFLALVFRLADIEVPERIFSPLKTLGHAAVPMVLVIVGMELGRIKIGSVNKVVAGVIALRLLFAPLLAWWVADLVGLTGTLRSVVIIQASMPSAIMPIVFARLFGGNVEFVSKAVFYSTIGSILTIPLILLLLEKH